MELNAENILLDDSKTEFVSLSQVNESGVGSVNQRAKSGKKKIFDDYDDYKSQNLRGVKKKGIFEEDERSVRLSAEQRQFMREQQNQLKEKFIDLMINFEWNNGAFMELYYCQRALMETCILGIKQVYEQSENWGVCERMIQELNEFVFSQSNPIWGFKKLLQRALKRLFVQYSQSSDDLKIPQQQKILQNVKSYLEECWNLPSRLDKIRELLMKKIYEECQVLYLWLKWVPNIFIEFFDKDLLSELENYTILENIFDLSQCRNLLRKRVENRYQDFSKNYEFFRDQLKIQIQDYVDLMIQRMVAIYNYSKTVLQDQLELFSKKTEKMKLQNKYILIGLLTELSNMCYEEVQNKLNETFISAIDPDLRYRFATFIISYLDVLDMSASSRVQGLDEGSDDENDDAGQFQPKSSPKLVREASSEESDQEILAILKKIGKLESLTIEKVIDKDGRKGMLVRKDDDKQTQYLLHQNSEGQYVIVNTRFMLTTWYSYSVEGKKKSYEVDTDDDPHELEINSRKERLETIMKNNPLSGFISQHTRSETMVIQNNTPALYVGFSANLGSSLGYCLANIHKYKSKTEFMKDFGYNATLNGTLSFIAQQIPIFGTLLLVGGLGWTTLKLIENDAANTKSKWTQAGKIVLNTGTAVGGSITGAIFGQALIPVPILGALVGGILGGILGGTSSQLVISLINKKKFITLIENLEKTMTSEGYWISSREMWNIFGITRAYFMKSIPEKLFMHGDEQEVHNLWITMGCYAVLSVYQEQLDQKQKELREKNEKKKKKKNEDLPSSNLDQKDAEDLDKLTKWPISIELPQRYLQEKKIRIIDFIEPLEKFVDAIFSKV